MNENRPDVPFFTQLFELGHIILVHGFNGPAPGVPAEDLHAGTSELKSTLDGKGEAAGDGDVKADAHKVKSKCQNPKFKSNCNA
jgi:hypothetical protein